MTEEIYLTFHNIRKTFPGVLALDNISLDIFKGQIHALLGENGAGKSTLMNILYGLYHQDSGEIFLKGEKYEHNTPKNAIRNGIGMIHQHFMLIPNFTVLENIILGQRSPKPPSLEKEYFRKEILDVANKFGITVDLDLLVEEISVGMQQKIEILKALYKGAELLILDEPTSVLTPQESQELFKMLNDLNQKGTTIIFISHKLKEVMQISDRISVLRDGKLISTVNKNDTTPKELSRLMVGRDIVSQYEKSLAKYGEEVLIIENISLVDHHNKTARFMENLTAGRGWIALAAVILGKYNPWGVLLACFLFGAADALQMLVQIMNLGIPYQFLLMTPYILAMLAMAGVVGKVRSPSAMGKPYVKH